MGQQGSHSRSSARRLGDWRKRSGRDGTPHDLLFTSQHAEQHRPHACQLHRLFARYVQGAIRQDFADAQLPDTSANCEVLHTAATTVQQHWPELLPAGAYSVLNLSIGKITSIAEHQSLELRIEMQNAFNQLHYDQPASARINSSLFGVAIQARWRALACRRGTRRGRYSFPRKYG